MAVALLSSSGVDFDHSDQLDQALVGTFFFGMLTAHGMLARLTPPDIHALALLVYQDSLHYTLEAAAAATQQCIDATTPGYHDTMNAIVHRGIDAHAQYLVRDFAGLGRNLNSVLQQFHQAGD